MMEAECGGHRLERGMDFWLGWLAAALNLDQNSATFCGLPSTRERVTLMERGTEAQTGHMYFAIRDGGLPRYSASASVEVIVYL